MRASSRAAPFISSSLFVAPAESGLLLGIAVQGHSAHAVALTLTRHAEYNAKVGLSRIKVRGCRLFRAPPLRAIRMSVDPMSLPAPVTDGGSTGRTAHTTPRVTNTWKTKVNL